MSLTPLYPRPTRPRRRPGSPCRAVAGALAVLAPAAASATGFPPFSLNDTATVIRGRAVSVLDSGASSVVANDIDLEGDTLLAILSDDVDHGFLILNLDGTFLYVHDGGKDKDDRFRYRAFDGTGFSRETDVRITIVDDVGPPRITGQRQVTMDEDGARVITLADLLIQGGSGELQLQVGEGENYSVTGLTITPDANFNGVLSAPVQVTDDDGAASNLFMLQVNVRPVNDPPFVVGPVPDQIAQEGERFELPLAQQFDDVDTGDGFVFSAIGLPRSRSLVIDRSTGILSGTPQLADAQDFPFDVTIIAEDRGKATASLSFRLTVLPRERADLELSLSAQPSPAILGNTPLWEIRIDNVGTGTLDRGTVTAAWFSSGGPIGLSMVGTGCTVTGNNTTQPEATCPTGELPALASNSFLAQSTHQVSGDVHLTARLATDSQNDVATLALHVASSFSEGPSQNLAISASDVASADFDNDGRTDLIVAADELRVYYNTGARELATPGVVLGPGGDGALVTPIDWNLDGMADAAVARSDGRAAEIYLNDGAGGFVETVPLPVTDVTAMVGGDLNGDGQPELVVSSAGGTEQISNTGRRDPRVSFVNATVARDISIADLNLDGLADLVLTDSETRTIHVLMNSGDGRSFSETTIQSGSVASANADDVDGDGIPDLLLAIDDADLGVPVSRVLRNQLDGGFQEWARVGASPTSELFSRDVSGDGVVDLVTINATGVHQVYLGDNVGGFRLDDQQIASASTLRGHLVDINNDSFLDLILAGRTAGSVGIHANDGRGRFGLGDRTPPTVSLVGERVVRIDVGATFLDPGATATDDIDGDITSKILVDNPVDSSLVGTYSVTYAVTDRAGNLGQAVRSVQVSNVAVGGGGGGATGGFTFAMLLGLLAWRRRYCRNGSGSRAPRLRT